MRKKMRRDAKKTLMLRQVSAVFSMYLVVSLTFLTANAMATPAIQPVTVTRGFSFSASAIEFLNFLIPGVAAQDSCCVQTVAGDYCQSGVSAASCDAGYSANKCSDLAVPQCQIGTCVQQNGDCDASTTKEQCEDNSGFWSNQPLLAIPACTPTCCVYKSGAEIVDSQFVFFRNKCEKLPQAKDDGLAFEQQDIGFNACQQIVPAETKGYCTVSASASCIYTTKSDCDGKGGDFSSKRCSSCQQDFEQQCFNGDQGYGVYNFDSCGGPGNIINNCALSEICEDTNNVVQCVDKTCRVDVEFTNLGYDTAYLKSGQVEVLTKNGKAISSSGSSFNLAQGDQACVNFQGPGEQHYAATCQLGELLVFGMDDTREKVCVFSGNKAIAQPNDYSRCTLAGQSRAGLLSNQGVLSDVFDFLGGDFINPRWWDYYVIDPGFSDRAACESQGMCVEGPNNDCVPKYAPASVNLCGDCSTTEASNPWNKCGDAAQCTSRGYCQLTENKINPFAGATVCAIQTVTQKALIYGIGQLATPTLEKAKNDRVAALAGASLKDGKSPTGGAGGDAQEAIMNDQKSFSDRVASTLSIIPNTLGKILSLPSLGMNWLLEKASGTQTPAKTQEGVSALELSLQAEINRPFSVIGVLDYLLLFFNGPDYTAKNKANEKKALEEGLAKAKADLASAEKQTGLKTDPVVPTSTDPTGKITFKLTDGREVEYDPKKPAEIKVDGKEVTPEEAPLYKKIGDKKIEEKANKEKLEEFNRRNAAQDSASAAARQAESRATPSAERALTSADFDNALKATTGQALEDRLTGKIDYLRYQPSGPNGAEYFGKIGETTFYRKKGIGLDTVYQVNGNPTTDTGTRSAIDYLIGSKPAAQIYNPQPPQIGSESESSPAAGDGAVDYLRAPLPTPLPTPDAPGPVSNFLGRAEKVTSANVDSSQYYGGLYYFPIRRSTESSKEKYFDAIGEWWKAQGGFGGYLLSQFKSLGKGLLIGYLMDRVLAPYGGRNFSKLSAQYWIKQGVCYAVSGFWGKQICDKSDVLIPVLTCSVQTYVRGSVMSNNACVPVGAQGMAGVNTGFQNCEKCHADSFPCTAERCQALSSDSSCVYDPYARQCTPDPEKIKACDTTQNADLRIIEMNNTALPSNNVFVMRDIPYENLQQDIKIRTSLTAECRYTTNKTEGWASMKPLLKDGTLKFHNTTLDMSDFTRQNYTTFFLCQDACRKQEFSQIAELRLEKKAKPDLVGPVIVSKFPATDLPVEGGSNGRKDITITVETDEDAQCKYKEWPLAEGIDSFIGDISNIEKIASDLLNAGSSEQVLDSELSLTGLSYNDTNMTLIGPLGNFSKKHTVEFKGTTGPAANQALNNDKIYAYVFLCKDTKGNIGEVPGVVRFKVSNPFNVVVSSPEDTTVESRPVIEASTDKDSACRYSLENKGLYTNMTSFGSSGGKEHETTVDRLLAYGTHRVFVTCLDSDGFNIASAEKTFSVTRDTAAPRIVRAYKDADTLLVATNELTSCQYSFKSFAYGKGSEMTGNDPVGNEHRAEWRPETTYFLSCRDRFGNVYGTSLKTTQEAMSTAF